MKRTFWPHQQKAFDYASERKRVALFMEMRLGKALVAVRWAEHWKMNKNLIVCPKDVAPCWVRELEQEGFWPEEILHLTGNIPQRLAEIKMNFQTIHITPQNSKPDTAPKCFVITNPEALVYCPNILAESWDSIIFDESTKIKNPNAQITKAVNRFTDHISGKIILSGLPNPESELDYFEQFRFLYGQFMNCSNYWYFRKKHFRQWGYNWKINKLAKDELLSTIKRDAFVMSKEDAGIYIDKVRKKWFVQENDEQIKINKQILKGMNFVNSMDEDIETKWATVEHGWLLKVAGGFSPDNVLISNEKVKLILRKLEGDLRNEKCIIWCHYNHEIRFVYEYLTRSNIACVKYFEKERPVLNAETIGDTQIVIAQARAAQYGLNWSFASTSITYSNWPDAEIKQQAEERIVSITKKYPLLYVEVVTQGSLDEELVLALQVKKIRSALMRKRLNEFCNKFKKEQLR